MTGFTVSVAELRWSGTEGATSQHLRGLTSGFTVIHFRKIDRQNTVGAGVGGKRICCCCYFPLNYLSGILNVTVGTRGHFPRTEQEPDFGLEG